MYYLGREGDDKMDGWVGMSYESRLSWGCLWGGDGVVVVMVSSILVLGIYSTGDRCLDSIAGIYAPNNFSIHTKKQRR